MEKSEKRVQVGYAGACKSHDHSDLLTHVKRVTMHRAVGTGRLALLEWTSVKALARIRFEVLTLGAQTLFRRAMVTATVDPNHGFHGLVFPVHSACLSVVHS